MIVMIIIRTTKAYINISIIVVDFSIAARRFWHDRPTFVKALISIHYTKKSHGHGLKWIKRQV